MISKNFEIEEKVTGAFLKSKGVKQYELIKFENDPPDILAQIKGNLVGIEVRALVSSDPQVKLEKSFYKVFERVKEYLINSGINNLVIRIEPEKNVVINRDKCIEIIVNACLEKLDQIGFNRLELAKNPYRGIKKIIAYKSVDEGIVITFDSRSHAFGSLQDKTIVSVIEEKIHKLNKSRQTAPSKHSMIHEYWLLMTIEGTFYANYAGVHNDQISINLKNCFDKIFVYHERESWIVELKIVNNTM